MIVFVSEEERKQQRKKHKVFTFCKNCYSCKDPCGRTTVEKYRKFLKENGDEDLWGMGGVVSKNRPSDIHECKTDIDVSSRDESKEKSQ